MVRSRKKRKPRRSAANAIINFAKQRELALANGR